MPADPPRPRRLRRRLLQVVLGTLTGLILAEVGFDRRDHGAFPHLHLYEADPELGVRLRPNASQRLALRNGPVTTLTTNALGFRGSDWPPSAVDEMFVVGDSQVFGLGVEHDQTLAARLAALDEDHRAVLNAGVPTYGPLEYERVARELLEKRVPKEANAKLTRRTMIVVINVGNDLLEATAPNATRHAVWDGWVVRKENAPTSPPLAFPGRRWLMSESHAMYALRSFVFRRPAPAAPESAVPDLSLPLATAGAAHDDAAKQTAQLAQVWIEELEKAGKDHAAAEASLQALVRKLPRLLPGDAYGAEYRRTKGDPGDIVENGKTFFEGNPEGHDTAYLVKGAAVRAHVEELIAEAASKELTDPDAKAVTETFATRAKLEQRINELRRKAFAAVQAASPLEASLRRLKELCDKNLARLVVVVLPVDVQVFPEAWKKYGRPPLDMKPTRVLNQDLVASAQRLGLDVLDGYAPLLAAGPSVFLADDPHLSPHGHEILAKALLETLRATPAPLEAPKVEVPFGQTWIPSPAQWQLAPVIGVNKDVFISSSPVSLASGANDAAERSARWNGEPPAGCQAKRIAEWFRVVCSQVGATPAPRAVRVRERSAEVLEGDVSTVVTPHAAVVLAPLPHRKSRVVVDFLFADGVRSLIVEFPEFGAGKNVTATYEWSLRFEALRPPCDAKKAPGCLEVPIVENPLVDRVCRCQAEVHADAKCEQVIGAPSQSCETTYPTSCPRLLECIRGQPTSLPTCPNGGAPIGAAMRCKGD